LFLKSILRPEKNGCCIHLPHIHPCKAAAKGLHAGFNKQKPKKEAKAKAQAEEQEEDKEEEETTIISMLEELVLWPSWLKGS